MKKWTDNLPDKLVEIVAETDTQIESKLKEIDEQVLFNQQKVLEAFKKNNVSETYFAGSTGYGYDDIGRDGLDRIYADVFKTESAMVRPQIVSGTHSISTALFGMLRPGDDLLYITGMPYDTIQEVIGVSGTGIGSMKEYGIGFDYVPLTDDDHMDIEGLKEKLTDKVKVVAIQRSRGYATRDSFVVSEIADMIKEVRNISKDVIIFIDNCYGEFSETIEPTEVGADIMAGSLIKNAGGGLAKTGGYIVGRADLIEQAGYRLTTPGTGNEEGATLNVMRDFIQGFFLSPHVTGEAIKGAIYTSALLEKMGLDVSPKWDAPRTDLIQTVNFGKPEPMVKFAQAIQHESPVDAYVEPKPSEMAGYEDKVIMAAGTFVEGASVELSADGPLREPYTLYVQGGLTYAHVKLAVTAAVEKTFY
ncbi:aminotransferase class I/II-fold pyridoxal phosphate-dependent enzyme [Dellaglioa algida]|uniref:methionine gamma-lyase family protein n=1 Tax=Dellaglioa algida TaxID=105612 RepID=UPI000BD63C3F|nr:methionine gamma-lyase family protein [Dellaglioa algida]MDK1718551.1 methionine gamma-lyase family protein [Dellaglioa algida]MDK1727420.1 methionine gamma-lyase family protein [Dellaglioa algida]MDK1729725.1 methionine gamma-lyase family protein [Dellaglioa algida]MDK1735454.1 methionine gamma-lyase family protein [Dellaglioa algida]MDK1736743.1 methionine gamma-lyase family protein [Dellaglioa algida]